MLDFLKRAFPLQRGDLSRGILLAVYLFFIISAYLVARVVRDTLFLAQYPAELLPYADITVFILVPVVVAGYIWIGRRTGLRWALIGSLVLFSVGGLVAAARAEWSLLSPVFYVLVGIFGVLAPAQGWTLANYVLTPREAKRVFGLVAAGAVCGSIFGGFLSRVLTDAYGANSLLVAIAVLLLIATVVVEVLWRRRPDDLASLEPELGEGKRSKSLRESLGVVAASPYLRAVAGVIGLSSLVTYVIGWQFKAIVQQFVFGAAGAEGGKDALASFFGTFEFAASIACLAIQVLFTAGILRRSGLRTVLFVLPLGLLVGSVGLLLSGALLVRLLPRAIDRVLRYSLDKPAVELLYLPVPLDLKLTAKSFIDTVVWRAGDGLGGLILLLVVTLGGLGVIHLSWVMLPLIGIWLAVASLAYRRYVGTLEESLQQHRLDVERAGTPVLDRVTTEMLAERLEAVDPKEILYALDQVSAQHHETAHPAVRGLLDHPAAEVRRRALEILNQAGDDTVAERVEALLDDPSLEVRTEALLYLARHADVDPVTRVQDFGGFTEAAIRGAVISVLARLGEDRLDAARLLFEAMVAEEGPGGHQMRLEAARLAEGLPTVFEGPLRKLMMDADPEIARAAIRAVRRHRSGPFADLLLQRLGDGELREEARDALASAGVEVVDSLARALELPETPTGVRRALPGVLEQIGGDEAAAALAGRLLTADAELRLHVLKVLGRMRERSPRVEIDSWAIEAVLGAEILGHYRSYQILGALELSTLEQEPTTRGLRIAMLEEVERIFLLLGLLYPRTDFRAAWEGLRSGNSVLHDQALDLLESQLRPEVRTLLVPLIDPVVHGAERMRLAEQLAGTPVDSPEEAVRELAGTGDPWLKACAAYAIGALNLRDLEGLLDDWRHDPDPLLRETVRQAREQFEGR
jgi:AAA family ATP:ADP antiporter